MYYNNYYTNKPVYMLHQPTPGIYYGVSKNSLNSLIDCEEIAPPNRVISKVKQAPKRRIYQMAIHNLHVATPALKQPSNNKALTIDSTSPSTVEVQVKHCNTFADFVNYHNNNNVIYRKAQIVPPNSKEVPSQRRKSEISHVSKTNSIQENVIVKKDNNEQSPKMSSFSDFAINEISSGRNVPNPSQFKRHSFMNNNNSSRNVPQQKNGLESLERLISYKKLSNDC